MTLSILLAVVTLSIFASHFFGATDTRAFAGQTVKVIDVIAGDRIMIESGEGLTETVQLLGVVSPEPPFSDASQKYLAARLKDRTVILQFDGTRTRSADGSLLALAYINESDCINVDLVRDGHAFVDRRGQTFLRSQLASAESDARKKQRGMWKDMTFDQQPEWRKQWIKSLKID